MHSEEDTFRKLARPDFYTMLDLFYKQYPTLPSVDHAQVQIAEENAFLKQHYWTREDFVNYPAGIRK